MYRSVVRKSACPIHACSLRPGENRLQIPVSQYLQPYGVVELEAMRSIPTGSQLAAAVQEKVDAITAEIEAHESQIAELIVPVGEAA
jgi:hypothetical protein